jgi:hypothetical protein
MGSITHLKGEFENLSPEEQAEFRAWLSARDAQSWDEQIAADSAAGRFDQMIAEAITERAAGKSREL